MIRTSVFPSLALAGVLAAQQAPVSAPHPVDLAICLDISGSMSGLINAARQNLWAVVNDLATLQPAPQLRVALLTFGCQAHDPARGWVKVETGFTHDLDKVSQLLFALGTNGGEEYVARVVRAAADELEWSSDGKALKLLFVAGNEAATQDPTLDTVAMCRAAIGKGIVVNTIYCGKAADDLAPAWRAAATAADGQFAAIEQDHTVVVTTPFDGKLAELSTALNTTYVPYGKAGAGAWANQGTQDGNAASLNVAAAAQRCQTKASGLYSCAQWDLVDACRDAKFKLESVAREELPEALRTMDAAQLRAHVEAQRQKRDGMKKEIDDLGKQRDAFVLQEQKRRSEAGEAVFEQAVLEAVRQQAEGKGFARRVQPPAKDTVDERFVQILKDAASGYEKFARVGREPRPAPTDCRMPLPIARLSAAEKQHGGKLYMLYARMADGDAYVKAGEPAAVGQTLVKEAWAAVIDHPAGRTGATARYGITPQCKDGDRVLYAGEAAGLFVMHKLDAATPGTDQGWIYGTIDAKGTVTSAGAVASCMRCHKDATEDRRFGLR